MDLVDLLFLHSQVEDEIVMLRSLLSNKVRRSVQLKQNLGVTPFKEFKHDLQSGLSQIRESTTYVTVH